MKKDGFHLKTFLSTAGPGRTIEHVPRNQILFSQGKRGDAVFYILAGTVGLTVASHDQERIISLLGPGSFAGKECVAAVRPLSMSSGLSLTACTLLRIERKEMLHLIKSQSTFAEFFLNYLLGRISRYQEALMDQLFDSSETRLARTLLLLTNFGDGGNNTEEVVPSIGQEVLAEVVGTTRSRVSFFLNRFRQMGFVAYKNRSPVKVNRTKLSAWLTAERQMARKTQAQPGR